jgi:hypothetical protein
VLADPARASQPRHSRGPSHVRLRTDAITLPAASLSSDPAFATSLPVAHLPARMSLTAGTDESDRSELVLTRPASCRCA